jgi:DNA replication and repair protein RecF
MLATGKSFRSHREIELIRTGSLRAEVTGEARLAVGNVHLYCMITTGPSGTRKSFELNGASVGFSQFLGQARVVTFVPADLALVTAGPAVRRTFLNNALAQISATYYRHLARYGRVLAQKGALLRGAIAPDRDLLLAYNDELLSPAAALIEARFAFITELREAAGAVYERWAGARERPIITYAPNVDLEHGGDTKDRVAAALAANLELEIRRKTTLVGPHRDDLRIILDDRPLATYGSQGQQRTAVLALKVAEYEVMRTRTGDAPILLLDDVLSELDAQRSGGFLEAVGHFEQAFLTATEFPAQYRGATRFAIAAAVVDRLN